MIHWITKHLGTAAKKDAAEEKASVVDVTNLVDGTGNDPSEIEKKINETVEHILAGEKTVVVCQYGMSRSNAIAIGALIKTRKYDFVHAARLVMKRTGEEMISLGMLNDVRRALHMPDPLVVRKKKKTIVVTGSSGLLGPAVKAVLEIKHKVILPARSEVDLLRGSLNLDLVVQESDASGIVHLASPRIHSANRSLGEMLIMLKNVLEVCVTRRIPVFFPSGGRGIYAGYVKPQLSPDENLPLKPRGVHAEAKFLCETLIEQHRKVYGLSAAVLRFPSLYSSLSGPQIILNLFRAARAGKPLVVHRTPSGSPVMDLVFANDAAQAIGAAIDKNFFGVLNIGSGQGISTRTIAEKINSLYGFKSPIVEMAIQDSAPSVVFNTSRAASLLEWRPRVSLDEGLRRLFAGLQ